MKVINNVRLIAEDKPVVIKKVSSDQQGQRGDGQAPGDQQGENGQQGEEGGEIGDRDNTGLAGTEARR